jgi:hypothetical protein
VRKEENPTYLAWGTGVVEDFLNYHIVDNPGEHDDARIGTRQMETPSSVCEDNEDAMRKRADVGL